MARIITDLSGEYNPAPLLKHKRKTPKRGNRTKFSPKVRKAIIERDGGLCVFCKRPYVHIHHILLRSQLGVGEASNGCCICFTCHQLAHSDSKVKDWFVKYRKEHLLNR